MIPRDELGGRLSTAMRNLQPLPGITQSDEMSNAHRQAFPALVTATALEERRSQRQFTDAQIPEGLLLKALAAGAVTERMLWPHEQDEGCSLRVLVLADRVAGHGPGVFHYAQDRLIPAGPLPGPWSELVLQRELAGAAAVIVWTGGLVTALRLHGAHGYRQLLTRAGAAANACAIEAQASGAAGCLFDGLFPDASLGPGGLDGINELALIALAVGMPVPPWTPAKPSPKESVRNSERGVR